MALPTNTRVRMTIENVDPTNARPIKVSGAVSGFAEIFVLYPNLGGNSTHVTSPSEHAWAYACITSACSWSWPGMRP